MLNSKSDQSIKYETGFVLSSNDGKCPAVALYSALFKMLVLSPCARGLVVKCLPFVILKLIFHD